MLYRRDGGPTTCGELPEATVIRVPLASASAGVIGLAGVPYRVRRGLVPIMAPMTGVLAPSSVSATISTSHPALPAAEPSFRAPWGELERELPYVTITTQPWPEEWWRPAARRMTAAAATLASNAIARATDRPSERIGTSAVAVPVDTTPAIAIAPLAASEAIRESATPDRIRNRDARRTDRGEAPRRGFLGRLALVAAGLVLSLIAVESATRRRH
jgi:hypothetical protein